MRKIVASNIVLGEPLAFSIYDDKGRLLLRRGTVVTMPDQVDRLIARGAMFDDTFIPVAQSPAPRQRPPVEKQSAFDRVGSLLLNLKHIVGTALKTPEQIDVATRIGKIAEAIQELSAEDVDATLAAVYLDYQNPYILVHQFMGAVLTEVIGRRKGIEDGQRLPIVCAALTRDWGQLPLQGELERIEGTLPDDLKARMRTHPAQGADMLAQAGVSDPLWLEGVRCHHERLDGSGYPTGLQANSIPVAARILAIADIYSAMAKPRPYRKKAHYPQNALREIYLKKDKEIDGELAHILIKEIGLYPPGSIVRLKCGEIAVIKRPTSKIEGTSVYSIYGKTGMVVAAPIPRDTSLPEFEVTGLVPFSDCRAASIMIKRVWVKESS